MMKKNVIKRISGLLFVVLLTFSLTTPSFAAFGESVPHQVTVNGRSYEMVSLIHNENSGKVNFQTSVYVLNGKTVPTGYMGCSARIYTSTGTLKYRSEYEYNRGNDASFLTSAQYSATSGYYYSEGAVKLFNGFDYEENICNKTTNFAPGRGAIPSVQIHRNENGEIYGSELFLNEIGIQPDLVQAMGSDGTTGYVRNNDLDDGVRTPADAVSAMRIRQSRSIPLYESDGMTVIGTFVISP